MIHDNYYAFDNPTKYSDRCQEEVGEYSKQLLKKICSFFYCTMHAHETYELKKKAGYDQHHITSFARMASSSQQEFCTDYESTGDAKTHHDSDMQFT